MLVKMRNIVKQKGQGIVEYALILAFVVGIAMMLNGADLGGAVKDTFDKVAAVLDGEKKQLTYAEALSKWGKAADSAFTDETAAERLVADQQALANIATFFIGKDRDFVKNMLWEYQLDSEGNIREDNKGNQLKSKYSADNSDVLLGHFTYNDDGGTTFLKSKYLHDEGDYLYNWIQADYGDYVPKNGKTPASLDSSTYTSNMYDSSTKYLFSEYSLNNPNRDELGKNGNLVNNDKAGVKIKLKYENDKVVAARIAIDSKSHENGDPSKTSPKGLGVEVRQGQSGYTEIECTKNGGIPKFN